MKLIGGLAVMLLATVLILPPILLFGGIFWLVTLGMATLVHPLFGVIIPMCAGYAFGWSGSEGRPASDRLRVAMVVAAPVVVVAVVYGLPWALEVCPDGCGQIDQSPLLLPAAVMAGSLLLGAATGFRNLVRGSLFSMGLIAALTVGTIGAFGGFGRDDPCEGPRVHGICLEYGSAGRR